MRSDDDGRECPEPEDYPSAATEGWFEPLDKFDPRDDADLGRDR